MSDLPPRYFLIAALASGAFLSLLISVVRDSQPSADAAAKASPAAIHAPAVTASTAVSQVSSTVGSPHFR